AMVFTPSSDALSVTVQAGPTGLAVTGSFAIGDAESALPVGSVLAAAEHDVSTGRLSGRLWVPPGEVFSSFAIENKGELIDIPVAVEPLRIRMVVLSVDSAPATSSDTCVFEPVELELTGSVDATGLHLRSPSATVPTQTTNWCDNQRGLLETGISLSVDVPL